MNVRDSVTIQSKMKAVSTRERDLVAQLVWFVAVTVKEETR